MEFVFWNNDTGEIKRIKHVDYYASPLGASHKMLIRNGRWKRLNCEIWHLDFVHKKD